MASVMYLCLYQVDKDETKLGKKRKKMNPVFTSFEMRGLPLKDKRLLQSFFWASAENDRHIGCWDDDILCSLESLSLLGRKQYQRSVNSTVCTRLPTIENWMRKKIKINFFHSIFLHFRVENFKINSLLLNSGGCIFSTFKQVYYATILFLLQ